MKVSGERDHLSSARALTSFAQAAVSADDKGQSPRIVSKVFAHELCQLLGSPRLARHIEHHDAVVRVQSRQQPLFFNRHLTLVIAGFGVADFRDVERTKRRRRSTKSSIRAESSLLLVFPIQTTRTFIGLPVGRKSGALSDQFMHMAALARPPQPFEIVELARLCRKDMDDEIDVVQQDPFTFLVSFDVERTDSLFAESFVDAFCDRLIVPAGGAGADDEVVGERADVVEVDDDNILRLLVEGGFQCFSQLVVLRFLVNSLSPHE